MFRWPPLQLEIRNFLLGSQQNLGLQGDLSPCTKKKKKTDVVLQALTEPSRGRRYLRLPGHQTHRSVTRVAVKRRRRRLFRGNNCLFRPWWQFGRNSERGATSAE